MTSLFLQPVAPTVADGSASCQPVAKREPVGSPVARPAGVLLDLKSEREGERKTEGDIKRTQVFLFIISRSSAFISPRCGGAGLVVSAAEHRKVLVKALLVQLPQLHLARLFFLRAQRFVAVEDTAGSDGSEAIWPAVWRKQREPPTRQENRKNELKDSAT